MPSTPLKKIIFVLSVILFLAGVGMILYAIILGPEAETGGYYFEFGGVVLAFVPAVLGLAGLSLTYWSDKGAFDRHSPAELTARNRKDLLKVVDQRIIQELSNSVYDLVFLDLGITPEKGQTEGRPWRLQELPSGERLPVDMCLSQIYEESGRSLLILGEPASGKSTTMFQLAEELITAAKIDDELPIPIIFNLSSWAVKRGPLIDWLAESAFIQYGDRRKAMRSWLEKGDSFAIFLDGLDEVDEDYRDECVAEINTYYQTYEGELVICSRTKDYSQLSQKLELNHAIEIQPLTVVEAERYLSRFEALQAIRIKVSQDKEWQKLVESPLMLTLMPLAFEDGNFDSVRADNTVDLLRTQLLSRYIAKVFNRRKEVKKRWDYNDADALTWLHNLAGWMDLQKQSEFYIERLQPKLIGKKSSRYHFFSGLIGGMFGVLGVVLIFELIFELIFGLTIGLTFGLTFGLIMGVIMGIQESRRAAGKTSRLPAPQGVISRAINILFIILSLTVISGAIVWVMFGYLLGLDGIIHPFALRWELNRLNILPGRFRFRAEKKDRLVLFLDDMADLALLKRIGGGWRFIHRYLLEHLAEHPPESLHNQN